MQQRRRRGWWRREKGTCASSNYGRYSGIICLRIVAAKHCCAAKRSTIAVRPSSLARGSFHPLRPFVRPSCRFKRIVPFAGRLPNLRTHCPRWRTDVCVCAAVCAAGPHRWISCGGERSNFGNSPGPPPPTVFSATAN